MIKADFGSIIATKRKECKLSQPQLAALMCKMMQSRFISAAPHTPMKLRHRLLKQI